MTTLMAALVWAAACAPQNPAEGSGSLGATGQTGLGESRGAYLWTKTVRGDFEQVVEDIKGAVASRNFPVGAVRDYRESFTKRLKQIGGGALPFEHYRIIEFCNVQLAIKSLSTDLRMGIFMPCRIVVFSPPGGETITLMTLNPSFMARTLGNPSLENPSLTAIAKEVEAVILEIFLAVE